MEGRTCEYCGEMLVRRERYGKRKIGGKYYDRKIKESSKEFGKRRFCGYKCSASIYTKKSIFLVFVNIKNKRKYNSKWLAKNNPKIISAIQNQYGKHYWFKFSKAIGFKPMRNMVNPVYKSKASSLLKYWNREEIHNGIGNVFVDSIDPWCQDRRLHSKAINYLKKIKAIRLFRDFSRIYPVRLRKPSQYVLLKTRI